MSKILVVDDEKIVLDAINFILDKDFHNIFQIENARSGREAIEKCEIFNPDIVLMDIRMPGISGIDAIKEIKKNRNNTFFIIISAYEQFEFVKEALNLGVKDYIIKPIIRKDFTNSLESVLKKVDEEKQKKLKEIESLERYQNVIPFLEQGFINSILLGENNEKIIDDYKNILGFDKEGGYILILEVTRRESVKGSYEKLELYGNKSYYQVFKDVLKYKCNCLIGSPILGRITAFIPTDPKPDSEEKNEAYEIAFCVYEKLRSFQDELKFVLGIGSYKTVKNICISYEEAVKTLKYTEHKEIIHINDIVNYNDMAAGYSKDEEKKINSIIIHAKNYISENYEKEITLEEVSKAVAVTPQYFSRLFKKEMGENFIDYLTKIRIDMAKKLMKNSNLSIKEICFNVGYSDPNYFSSIFKKIEKMSPSVYMKNINDVL